MPDPCPSEYKDALRLSEAEIQRLLADREKGPSDGGLPRGSARTSLGVGISVPAVFEQPGGNQSQVMLRAVDISPVGVGVLHGGFIHMGTKAKLYFPTPDGETFVVDGEVQRATHLKGRVHELGIAFSHRIDVSFIVDDDPDDAQCGVAGVIRELGGIAKRIASAATTARSSREVELLMTQINECWVRVLDAEVMAAEQDTTQEKAVEVASSARLLAESIERGASPKELRQIFGELEASLSNIARADGDGPESGQTEGAAGEAA